METIQCVYDAGTSSPEQGSSGSIDVKDVQNGSTFTVVLKANPHNGYLWYIDNEVQTAGIVLEAEKMEPLQTYSGTRQHFSFVAKDVGDYMISFTYKRSWEETSYATLNILIHVI